MWHHPKYYKELRKLRNKLDQAISSEAGDGKRERATGPGPKRQAASAKQQASSVKPQAPEASSGKHQAPSNKRQAWSHKLQAPWSGILQKVSSTFDQGSLLR